MEPATTPVVPQAFVHREVVDSSRLSIQHLRTSAEIAGILHLRDSIDLSVHARLGADFNELEKKEINAGSSALSISTELRSAPSEWFPWGWA